MSALGIDIDTDSICIYRNEISKHDALDCLVDAVFRTGVVGDREAFRRAVYEREAVMSTGIGSGVAIPHVRIDEVREPTVCVGISRCGIDFDTLDDEPVHVVVLFSMPRGSQKAYLGLLAQVMGSLRQPGLRERLVACDTNDQVLAVLNNPSEEL